MPFCLICGSQDRIDIHHVIPFRLTQDNSPENLISLCPKHHKAVEYIFVDILEHVFDRASLNELREALLISFEPYRLLTLHRRKIQCSK